MASMRDIKRRKSSIQSTQQITKAMKLVSTVKLQRAKQRAESSRPYFENMYATVRSILSKTGQSEHPFLKGNTSSGKGVILITANRGLAGGYNSNVIKLISRGNFAKEDVSLYTLGSKGRDTLTRYGYRVEADYSDMVEEPVYADAMSICKKALADFEAGRIGEIYLAYTYFKNTVVHEPRLVKLLPVDREDLSQPDVMRDREYEENREEYDRAVMNFEPNDEEALNLLIPKYITSMIYGGMVEAVASENGARMQAMDSATGNAEEMIADLTLLYNRARQGSITQELTEIIAGANAIS